MCLVAHHYLPCLASLISAVSRSADKLAVSTRTRQGSQVDRQVASSSGSIKSSNGNASGPPQRHLMLTENR